jgi:hypothetical protein
MKFKFTCLLALTAILLSVGQRTIAQSQSQPQQQYFAPTIAPRSPNTAALEKYGSYDVNLFTGVPNISIPIYTIEDGDLKVPITLSYHASGIKVTELASWVGLGWSLSAGGTISRRIVGIADDAPYGYLNGYMKPLNAIVPTNDDGINYLENASNGTYDTRPDIYSYDFPGHSGKFFFNGSDGSFNPILIPFAPLKITYAQGLGIINISDEHGTRYRYGDGNTEITGTNVAGTHVVYSTTGWQLKNMISQNNRDTVSFTYVNNPVTYPIADSEIWSVIDQVNVTASDCPYQGSYSTAPTTPGTNSLVQEKLLQHIYFKNGRIDFTLDGTARADIDGGGGASPYGLNNIKVYKFNFAAKNYELQKTIQFYKSYFVNPTNASIKRLRLDSLQIIDQAGTIVQHYKFDYNTAVDLPSYISKSIDYWGYFNNKPNDYLTPSMMVNYTPSTHGGTSTMVHIGSTVQNGRDCDSTFMQAYALTSIHYPTGGRTDFTYQTNQYYSNNSNQLKLAGGLRIAAIKSYDGINPNPIVKSYQYNSADSNFYLNYSFFSTHLIYRWFSTGGGNIIQVNGTENVRTYVSNPRIDLEPFDAAPVKYKDVTEYMGTPSNNTGKTEYIYNYMSDNTQDASYSGGDLAVTSYFFQRGLLLHKYDFIHKSDGTYQLAKRLDNTYFGFNGGQAIYYSNVGMLARKQYYNDGPFGANPITPESALPVNDVSSYDYPYYSIYTGDNYLTSTTTMDYDLIDPSKITTSSVQYKYDNITHQQISRTYHTDSKGNTTVTRSKYPADYLQSASSTNNAVLDTMLNHNMQAEVIEKYDTVKNVTTNVTGITNGQLNYYSLNKGSMGAVVPDKIAVLNTSVPLTDFVASTSLSGQLTVDSRYTQMISFDNYDIKNNLIRYRARNGIPVSIFWDYQYALPVAQIQGIDTTTTNAQVAYSSFETGNKNNWTYSGTPVVNTTAPSGTMVYPLSGAAILSPIMNLQQNYILSYWSNGGVATVSNGTAIVGTAIKTVNGWTYYEHQVPGSASQVSIAGSMSIDELRLYSSTAQMTTYAYNTAGLTTTMDAKNMASYYTYDGFQRLYQVKDQFGNIVKQNCYNYAGQVTNCAIPYLAPVVSPPVSRSITITGPATGYMGQSYTFTVQPTLAGDSFAWSLPSNIGTIQNGQGTSSVTILLNTLSGTAPYPYTITVAVTGADGSVSYASFASQSVYCNNCAVN